MPPESEHVHPGKPLLKLRRYFTTGLLVLAPTAVTVWVLVLIFRMFDGVLGSFYAGLFEYLGFETTHVPGLGALTLAVIITLFGYLVRFYAGRKLFDLWESVINRLPFLCKIYTATRQLSDVLRDGAKMNLGRPVFVEYPRAGLYTLAYIVNEKTTHFSERVGKRVIGVYIPTTPNPTSGMLIYVPEDELIPLDISSEDVMKLIVSAGFVGPDEPTVQRIT